jgi:hypothetical protein
MILSAKKSRYKDEIILISLCGYFTFLLTVPYKPIWVDEFLHFSIGGFDTSKDAWNAIIESIKTFNHGQTGIYIFLNYWLLKILDANSLALRAPSLLSAFLLLYSSALFIKQRGFGLAWQLLTIIIMFSNTKLMYFGTESRPYMPLAGAVVGIAVYYCANFNERSQPITYAIGMTSVLWGVLMHPYFILYWSVLLVYGAWFKYSAHELKLNWRFLVRYANPQFLCVGGLSFITLALHTWLLKRQSFDLNPFEWISRDLLFYKFLYDHVAFIKYNLSLFEISVFLLFCSLTIIRVRLFMLRKSITQPVLLILLAITTSIAIATISFYQNYWILTRQWVGSMPLVGLGFAWLMCSLTEALADKFSQKLKNCIIFLGLLVTLAIVNDSTTQRIAQSWSQINRADRLQVADASNGTTVRLCPQTIDDWVQLANENIKSATPVWSLFKHFYTKTPIKECEGEGR